ncbi:MAG: type VI secretion system baseplate subunit TssK [Planctomycetota bacterium]
MRHLPVNWSEGMFLRPHHFQAADRHAAERLALSTAADDPCCYGIVRLEIDPVALASRQLELRACQARLRDGTLVWLEPGEEPQRVGLATASAEVSRLSAALGDSLQMDDSVRVYLALPRFDPGGPNVAPPGPPDRTRSTALRQTLQDEGSGGNDQEVEFLRHNLRIKLSTEDLSGFELLPIAQIRQAGNREGAPEIDPDYFPPMLAIDVWPPLGRDVVRGVYDLIGRKVEVLTEQVVSRQVGFSSSEPGDLDRLFMLSKLLEARGVLRVVAFARGIHPRTAFAELCRVAGQLAVFEADRRLEELPVYDHDDLARVFRRVKEIIESMLSRVAVLEFEQRYFVGIGTAALSVTLDPKWLQSDWQCYVGVLRGDMSEEVCHRLLTGDNHLDWKLGSTDEVDRLFRMGVPGLELFPVDRPPRALPARSGWLYYRIGTENPAWRSVQATQSMGIRLRDSSILNPDELAGRRRVEVAYESQVGSLEFALFAVPR